MSKAPTSTKALLIAVLVPKVFIDLAIGLGLLVIAFRDWHGNVVRMLLLKLLDAEQKREEGGPEKGPFTDTTVPSGRG